MRWGELFDAARSAGDEPTVDTILATLEARRSVRVNGADPDPAGSEQDASPDTGDPGRRAAEEPDPSRVVADADVLAADLLRGGDARVTLDHVRRHSWMTLVASSTLLEDAEAVLRELGGDELATAWRECVEADARLVEHPSGDHPAIASAAASDAAHVLSYDDHLVSARGNLTLRAHLQVSVRTPAAFDRLFDPERLYPAIGSGEYPGPDRDPRA